MNDMQKYDELKIYRGSDIQITKKIIVTQPTLGQIEEFGEKRYFSAIRNLTGVGADFKWQLYDQGIDYTEISDYELFIKLLSQFVGSRKKQYQNMPDEAKSQLTDEQIEDLCVNPLSLILKDIDLANFIPCHSDKTDGIVLYDIDNDITIDQLVYQQIVDIVRKIHGLKRNNQLPGNEATKMDLIEDARDDYLKSLNEPYVSYLQPLISSLINHEGFKFNHNDVWNMKINAFFDSVKRLNKIQDAQMLMQGAYSGFTSLKGIDKERLNWVGTLT